MYMCIYTHISDDITSTFPDSVSASNPPKQLSLNYI